MKKIARVTPTIRSKPNNQYIRKETENYENIKKMKEFEKILRRGEKIILYNQSMDLISKLSLMIDWSLARHFICIILNSKACNENEI